jgi:hypothetical protein
MQKFTYFAEVFTLWWLTVNELTSNKLLAVNRFLLRFVDCGVSWCEDNKCEKYRTLNFRNKQRKI